MPDSRNLAAVEQLRQLHGAAEGNTGVRPPSNWGW